MEKDNADCGHCEAQVMGEVEVWEEGDLYTNMEHCYCPDCGEDFVFPFDNR